MDFKFSIMHRIKFLGEYKEFEASYENKKEIFTPNWNMKGHQLIHYLKDHIKKFSVENSIKINRINRSLIERNGISYNQERLLRVLSMRLYQESKKEFKRDRPIV